MLAAVCIVTIVLSVIGFGASIFFYWKSYKTKPDMTKIQNESFAGGIDIAEMLKQLTAFLESLKTASPAAALLAGSIIFALVAGVTAYFDRYPPQQEEKAESSPAT